jgi:hypothetical protein
MSDSFDPYYKWLGIPPWEQPPDHYRLLGITLFEADPEVIAHAADQRMAHLKNLQTGKYSLLSQPLLNEIAAAKVVLLTPHRKAAYDQQLRGPARAAQPSLTSFLDLGKPFWQRLGVAVVAVVLCVAAITFLLARDDFEEAGSEALRGVNREPNPVAKLPDSATHRGSNATDALAATTAEKHAPVLPAAMESAKIGPRGASHPTAVATPPNNVDSDGHFGPPVSGLLVKDSAPLGQVGSPRVDPTKPLDEEPAAPRLVHLDDLDEVDFRVACGSLGKHGATGYLKQELEYGQRAVFRGRVCPHALSIHPPSKGASYVVYNLKREFRTFRATAAILEVGEANAAALQTNALFMGKAYTPLTFKVYGDGELLWQSRPIEKSGDWQDCSIRVEGVNLLELQVHCPGTNAFAWAAWVDPQLSR